MNTALALKLRPWSRRFLLASLLLSAAAVAGALLDLTSFLRAYLFAYLLWLGLVLGCLELLLIHHLTGGKWGYVTRRFLESATRTLPLMALLFLPILLGYRHLYPWAHSASAANSKILQHQAIYLNLPFFAVRACLCFALWIALSTFINRWSAQQDQSPDPAPTQRLRALSGPGVVLCPLAGTFALIDWIMSLEPDFHSTIFPVIAISGQVLLALSFLVLLLALFKNQPPLASTLVPEHFHDLGNLLLTFVMFWTYVAISQLIIIYAGNLPREISWYQHRIAGAWKWLVAAIALFNFFVPFFLLLFRAAKKRIRFLALIAAAIAASHVVDLFWMIQPSFYPAGFAVHWLDLLLPLAIGAIWLTAFVSQLPRLPLLPQNDPREEHWIAYAQPG